MAKQYYRITPEGRLEFSDKRNEELGFIGKGEPGCCKDTPVPHNPVCGKKTTHCTCSRCF